MYITDIFQKCTRQTSVMEKQKKNKRRGSQMFKFEQNEETLYQNEAICNLYKNKNYLAPEPKEFEAIPEEGKQWEGKTMKVID